MAEKLKKLIHDINTGEPIYVEMTDAEQAEHEAAAAQALAAARAQEEAKIVREQAEINRQEALTYALQQIEDLKAQIAKMKGGGDGVS